MTRINEENCLEFSPRSKVCPSWPVRVVGQQGLWRYVGPINMESVEVIGPYFPNNPARNGGRSRIFKIDQLRYAGKRAKPVDVISVETTALSNQAHSALRLR